jgi:hypothetical protein
MANNLLHENDTRDNLATQVRTDIHAGVGANVTLSLFTQAEGTQTGTGFATVSIGATPFAAVNTTNHTIKYTGTATGTNSGAARTFASFAIYDKTTPTANKVLKGTVGNATGTFDLEITGGPAFADGEKIQLTAFTYTASV